MKLNIYGRKDGKKQIVKTYEAQTYNLMFGTVEELIKEVDLDSFAGEEGITNAKVLEAVSRMMVNSMGTIKDLLMDMFEGITEDEIRNTTIIEIAGVLVDTVIYTVTELNRSFGWGAEKNVKAAKSR